jgi:GNAT superfamily N-acetyltransferase
MTSIRKAHSDDCGAIAPLFARYREFYGQEPDIGLAAKFLTDRLERHEATVFFAGDGDRCDGFALLYPLFSSVYGKRLWLLNDLYVDSELRRSGIASRLLRRAEEFAIETQALGLTLRTGVGNSAAQHLYERCGYIRDTKFVAFDRRV